MKVANVANVSVHVEVATGFDIQKASRMALFKGDTNDGIPVKRFDHGILGLKLAKRFLPGILLQPTTYEVDFLLNQLQGVFDGRLISGAKEGTVVAKWCYTAK